MIKRKYILFLVSAFALFTSCNDDDKMNGDSEIKKNLPTIFQENNKTVAIYNYDNKSRLLTIDYLGGDSLVNTYENEDLVKSTFIWPMGHGGIEKGGVKSLEYTKIGSDKILVKKVFSHNAGTYFDTIFINDNGFATKLRFENSKGHISYTYAPDGKLLKKEILNSSQPNDFFSKVLYEYDNKPGTFSRINCPQWFLIYYRLINSNDSDELHFLSYVNNVTKEAIVSGNSPESVIYDITYTYNAEGYPVTFLYERWKTPSAIQYK